MSQHDFPERSKCIAYEIGYRPKVDRMDAVRPQRIGAVWKQPTDPEDICRGSRAEVKALVFHQPTLVQFRRRAEVFYTPPLNVRLKAIVRSIYSPWTKRLAVSTPFTQKRPKFCRSPEIGGTGPSGWATMSQQFVQTYQAIFAPWTIRD